jgi:hypothetical protein
MMEPASSSRLWIGYLQANDELRVAGHGDAEFAGDRRLI